MGKKSKKGGGFEREMCKLLSKWYTHGERDDIFWRTAGSGGRATVRMKQGKMTADSAGDMCAIDEIGKKLTAASIWEMKRGYSGKGKQKNRTINLITILDKLRQEKDPLLVDWFIKLRKEMREHDRETGFIIFKRDRKNACIAFTTKTFKYLKARNVKKYFFPSFGPVATILCYKIDFVVMLLEDFLEWCEPETIGRPIRRRMRGAAYEQGDPERFEKWRQPEYDPNFTKFKVEKTQTKFERFLPVSRVRKGSDAHGRTRTITRRSKK